MANKRVKIYERIKTIEGWKTVPVKVSRTKVDGTLFLKDDRQVLRREQDSMRASSGCRNFGRPMPCLVFGLQ